MTKSAIRFNAALEPIATPLPPALAQTIGRTIARHSYLEWVMGQVLYSLLEISIKQGRKVVARPSPRAYAASIEGLFAFHRLESRFDLHAFAQRVEKADRARDALAHGVYMRDANAPGRVHLVQGCWAVDDAQLPSGDGWPEAPALGGVLLSKLKKDVEDAAVAAEKLQAVTDRLLREMHETRRTNPRFNRRREDGKRRRAK